MAKKPHRRGKVRRHFEIEVIKIAAWCPDEKAQTPPTQVHLIFNVKELPYPLVLRFENPDTLGFLLAELARYRAEVWPDAEPLDLNPK